MTFDDALLHFAFLATRTRQAAVRNDSIAGCVLFALTEAARARLIACTPRELIAWAEVNT